MKQLIMGTIAVWGVSVCAAATPTATLLFAQEGTQIVDASGIARAAKKGDLVQSGERVLTAPGGISQIQLPDGSLIGVRPGSELKLATPDGPSPAPVVTLIQGAARLIGSELMDAKKISNITFQSGVATLRLQGADLESAVVRADKGTTPPPGATGAPSVPGAAPGTAPGSYQRLLIGTGSIGAGAQITPMEPRQVNFVGLTPAAPMVVATAMPVLNLGARLPAANLGDATLVGTKTTQPAPIAPVNTLGGTAVQSPTAFVPLAPVGTMTASALPVAPSGSMTSSPLQPAPAMAPPPIIAAVPMPTAPIVMTPFIVPAPVVMAINVAPLPPPPIVIQPIVSLTNPIVMQPVITKPPVCTRLISGKCV